MMQSESNISGLIYQLAKLQKYFLNQHLSNLDLNSDQAKVLTFIAANPGANQRQVSVELSRGQVLEKAFAANVPDPEALTVTLKQVLKALQ